MGSMRSAESIRRMPPPASDAPPVTAVRPITVEFVGLPASGKSSIAHALGHELRRLGVSSEEPTYELAHARAPARRIAGKSRWAARAMLRQPRAVRSALGLVARSRQPGLRDAAGTAFNLIFLSGLVGTPGSAIRILDQGPTQGIASVWWRGRERAEASAQTWLEETMGGCGDWWIVSVDLAQDAARDRIAARSVSQSRIERSQDDGAAWRRMGSALQAASELARNIVPRNGGRARFVTVSGSDERGPEGVAIELARELTKSPPSETREPHIRR